MAFLRIIYKEGIMFAKKNAMPMLEKKVERSKRSNTKFNFKRIQKVLYVIV